MSKNVCFLAPTFNVVAEGSAGSCLKALGGGAAVASASRRRTSPAPTATDSRDPHDEVDSAETADTCKVDVITP